MVTTRSESEASGSRGVQTSSTEDVWHDEIKSLNIADIECRPCQIILLAESDASCSEIVNNVHQIYAADPLFPVKFVCFDKLLETVSVSSPARADETDLQRWFRLASSEAIPFIEARNDIPCELLAFLIKLQIVSVIQEDIAKEQEDIFIKKLKEEEYRKLTCAEDSQSAGGGKKGKKDKKGKPEKAKEPAKKKGGKKKDQGVGENDRGVDEPRPLSKFKVMTAHPEITPTNRDLYIALVGFYDPEIIYQLITIGIPICCVLEVCLSNSTLESHQLQRTSTIYETNNNSEDVSASEMTGSIFDRIRHAYNITDGVPEQDSTENSSNHVEKPHDDIITEFWDTIIDMFHGQNQYQFLENTFHMMYRTELDTSKEKSMINLCEGLIGRIQKVDEIRRRYVNYMRQVKVVNLDQKHKFLPLQCLKHYRKLMAKFPPDCFSIALLMTCLVEEVVLRVPDTKDSNSNSSTEATSFKDSPQVSTEPSIAEEQPVHGGVLEQIALLMNRHKKRHTPQINSGKAQSLLKRHLCEFGPQMRVKIHSKMHTLHPEDKLEMLVRCYKQLTKDLEGVNIFSLKSFRSARIRLAYRIKTDIEKLTNVYNIETWAQTLKLSKDELIDAIHIYLLSKNSCKYEPKRLATSDLAVCLPYVTEASVCNEMRPKVYDFVSPESKVTVSCNLEESGKQFNYYENCNPACFSYKEKLPSSVLLQELAAADEDYLCMDFKYCPVTDSTLHRFHNRVDEFGLNTELSISAIATPICIRDFCQYVVKENADWLDQQETLFLEERQKQLDEMKQQKEKLIDDYYAFNMPDDTYFYDPESIKARDLQLKKMNEEADGKKVIELAKSKKGDAKKGKDAKKEKDAGKDSKKGKGKAAQTNPEDEKFKNASRIFNVLMEGEPKLPKPEIMPLRCANEDEPYSFLAYNLGNTRLQVSSYNTSFHSLDGMSAFVERLMWLGKPQNLRIKLKCNKNTFVFHYNFAGQQNQLIFHFVLSDNTFVTFAKPLKLYKIDVALCKRICRSKKEHDKETVAEGSAYERKPQELYFVSEKQDYVVKCLKIPFSTESNVILSEKILMPFLESLQKFNIKAHVSMPAETLRQRQLRRHNLWNRLRPKPVDDNEGQQEFDIKRQDNSSVFRKGLLTKYVPKVIGHRRSSLSIPGGSQQFLEHSVPEQTVSNLPEQKPIQSRSEFLQLLKTAVKKHLPVFKICSSRLHRFSYVTRAKSYVNIPIGNVVKRILYRANYRRTKRTIEIKKCLPIGCSEQQRPTTNNMYDLRIALPSGLMIRDVPGIDSEYPCLKQYYIDKGPQCRNILHEESRIFTRNGNIAIKRCDGNVDVLHLNGNIFKFEIPYLMKTVTERSSYRDMNLSKMKSFRSGRFTTLPLHACIRDLPQFQKFLHRTLQRRYKHLVDGKESRYFRSRRAYKKAQRKYCEDPNRFYLLQSGKGPFPEYSVITPEGKRIKISNSKAYEEHKYYVTSDTDHRNEEILYEREDQTYCFLNGVGKLITQFPDGTRITTWYEIEEELIYIDILEDKCGDMSNKEVQTNPEGYFCGETTGFEDTIPGGWVSIHIFYEYAHPNYATVMFGGKHNEMRIWLPNGTFISAQGNGAYVLNTARQFDVTVDNKIIEFSANKCTECDRKCKAFLNINAAYNNESPKANTELLRLKDSYGKLFLTDYYGRCTRNLADDICRKNDNGCPSHINTDVQKFFVVDKTFSGYEIWNSQKFNRMYRTVSKDVDMVAQLHGYDTSNPAAVTFRKHIYKPFHERYFLDYDKELLTLTKYKTNLQNDPVYITQRLLYKLPNIRRIVPIQTALLESLKSVATQDEYEKFQQFIKQTSENSIQSKASEDTDDACADPCLCDLREAFQPTKDLHDRWYEWQEECKKYKELLSKQYVPLYFKSKYAEQFQTEQSNTEEPEGLNEHVLDEMEESIDSEQLPSFSSAESGSPDTTEVGPVSPEPHTTSGFTVDKEKSVEVSETKSSTIKTIKERLQITTPENLVVLYNPLGVATDIELTKEKIYIESKVDTPLKDSDKKETHKMLLLTGVSEKSKTKIAKDFNPEAMKKTQEGQNVVLDYTLKDKLINRPPSTHQPLNVGSSPKPLIVPCNSDHTNDPDAQGSQGVLNEVATKLRLSIKKSSSRRFQNMIDLEDDEFDTISCPVFTVHTYIINPIVSHSKNLSEDPEFNMQLMVNKTLEVLVDFGIRQHDREELIDDILREAKLEDPYLSRFSEIFLKEVNNDKWAQKTSFYKKLPPHVQMLRQFLKLLNRHFGNINRASATVIHDISGHDRQRLRSRVTVMLANVINSFTNMLRQNSGSRKLTWRNRLTILDTALREVTCANFDENELNLFLQSLQLVTESEISKLSARVESHPKESLTAEKMAIATSMLKSIQRYRGKEDPQRSKITRVVLEEKATQSQGQPPLQDMSSVPPLKDIGSIYKHYSRKRGVQNIRREGRPSNASETYRPESKCGILKNISEQPSEALLPKTKERASSKRPADSNDYSTPASLSSSKVTVTYFKRDSPVESMAPVSEDSSLHCAACNYTELNESRVTIDLEMNDNNITESLMGFTSRANLDYQPSPMDLSTGTADAPVCPESSMPVILRKPIDSSGLGDTASDSEVIPPAIERESTLKIAGDYFMKKYNKLQNRLHMEDKMIKRNKEVSHILQQQASEFRMLHRNESSKVTLDSDEDVFFDYGEMNENVSPSMFPLYTSSLIYRQRDAQWSGPLDVEMVVDDMASGSYKQVIKKNNTQNIRILNSVGTQTQLGKDAELQTSDQLLTGRVKHP